MDPVRRARRLLDTILCISLGAVSMVFSYVSVAFVQVP